VTFKVGGVNFILAGTLPAADYVGSVTASGLATRVATARR
jgi:hypothetical protein